MQTKHISIVLLILPLAAGCVREVPVVVNPVDRMLESPRAELCAGVLAEALTAMQDSGYEWDSATLRRTLRWSFSHNHDNCGGSVTGRAVWLTAIAATGAEGGDEAGSGLVASLRVSHNLSQDVDRQGDALGEVTEAALQAMVQAGPFGADVLQDLIRWYSGDVGDCSTEEHRAVVARIFAAAGEEGAQALAAHFPPTPEDGRCAVGWMMSDVFEGLPAATRTRIINEMSRSGMLGEDLTRLLEVVDGTSGPLQTALAAQACELAVNLAHRAFDAPDGDPRDPVTDSFGACAAQTDGAQRILALQQRLTRWLVAHGDAEEAWTLMMSMPAEDVDDVWFARVGTALVFERLERSEALSAAMLYELLIDRLGADHVDVLPLRGSLAPALLEATTAALEAGRVSDARSAITAAERHFGETEETMRLRVRVAFREPSQVAGVGTCLEAEEMERIEDALNAARRIVPASFRGDTELRGLQTDAVRAWGRFSRRCRAEARRRR